MAYTFFSLSAQSVVRRFLARTDYRRLQKEMKTKQLSSTRIQTAYRAYTARKLFIQKARVASLYDASTTVGELQYDSAVVIQKRVRGNSARDKAFRNLSARKIQTQWRRFGPRRNYCQYRAAVRLQAICRMKKHFANYRCFLAARRIQSQWRCARDYNAYQQAKVANMRRNSAIRIQAIWRCKRTFSAYKQHRAAVRIQSAYRGKRSYDKYTRYRAATAIQCLWRAKLALIAYKQYVAARRIQAAWRGFIVKVAYMIYQEEKLAATVIQTAWRGFICNTDYLLTLNDIVTVQSLVRQRRDSKKVATLRQREAETVAARDIQRCFRGSQGRSFVRQEKAALNIQRSFRGFQGRITAYAVRAHQESERARQLAAVSIQRSWRGYDEKQRYWLTLFCTIEIQKAARGYVVRKRLMREHAAAITIQSVARGQIASTAFKRYIAATSIQAAWRGKFAHVAYMVYLAEKRAATIIQTAWRGFVGHTDYMLTLNDIVIAQKMARRFLACKEVTALRQEKAAIDIQRTFRGSQGRSLARQEKAALNIQRSFRGSQGRTTANHVRTQRARQLAAVNIQRSWRGYDQKQRYFLTLLCTIEIQKVVRGYIVHKQLARERTAATTIQSVARGKIASTAYKKHGAATRIQAAWRGKFARIAYIVYQAEKLAATIIQAAWRGFVGHTDYILTLSDIIIAQKMARRFLACKEAAALRQEKAAIDIQRTFRGSQGRSLARQEKAAINIQRSFRGSQGRTTANVVRAHLESERARQLAAVNIQRSWRGYDQKQRYWLTLFCTIEIQKVARGFVARGQLVREHAAATTIQSVTRGKIASTAYKKHGAATRIQAAWRGKFARIAYIVYQAEKLAAMLIQAAWRGFVIHTDYILTLSDIIVAQKTARRFLACKEATALRQEKAAIDIQRTFRGSQGRSLARQEKAAINIQRSFRGSQGRTIANHVRTQRARQLAAVSIQRVWRGYDQRKRYWFALECSLRIQKLSRGYIVREQLVREHAAATTIQSVARGKIASTAYKKHGAATRIQAAWRGKFARIAYIVYQAEKLAATIIQAAWRGFVGHTDFILTLSDITIAQKMARRFLACKKVTVIRQQKAALDIQRSFRGHQARNEAAVIRQQKAALDIQRSFRGHQGRTRAADRRVYVEGEKTHEASAVDIQRTWRGYHQNQRYWFVLGCSLQIQRTIRGAMVRDRLRSEKAAATKIQYIWRAQTALVVYRQYVAARRIQAAWRGKFAQIAYMVYKVQILAAVLIQSAWRGFVCCTDYIFTIGDVTTAQKMARGYLARKKVAILRHDKVTKDSAVSIQRAWRGYAQKQRHWYILGCTLQIQRAMRGILVRGRLTKQHAAATTIQAATRRSQAIIRYENKRLALMALGGADALAEHEIAVQTIERWWINLLIANQQKAVREEEAAMVLQNWSRRLAFAAKVQNYAVELWGATSIQSWWRRVVIRRQLEAWVAIVVIQRWWRLVLIFQFDKEDAAAAAIQLQWRMCRARMARKEILRERNRAAFTIQRFFLMVKAMVDREIRAEKERRKRKKMYKKFHTPEMEDALLETIWTNTVESPPPRKSRHRAHGVNRSSRAPRSQNEIVLSVNPPRGSRSSRRLSQLVFEVQKDMDDASIASHHTAGSSLYHVPPPRRSSLSKKDLDEDVALEEAWIDTEINFMKQKQHSSSSSKFVRSSSSNRRTSRETF